MVDPKTGKYDNLPHIGPGNIESFTGRILDNVKSVKEENLISGKFHFNSGDIIYGKINPQLGKYVLSNFEGLASADAYVLNTKNELTQSFLFRILQGIDFYKYSVSVSMRTGMPKINRDELNEYQFFLPSPQEQNKTGNFFMQLDNTIALHQQKLDKLKQFKKGFIQVMFPKKEKNVPVVRFASFTALWEQSKLGKVAEITGGGTPSTNVPEYWDGDIDWYSPLEIGEEIYTFGSRKKITEIGLNKSSAKVLPGNKTILFTSRAGIGDMAILKKDGATNQGFQSFVVNDSYDIYFIYSMGNAIKEFALKHASGSTFLEISGKELSKMVLLAPTLTEQIKIGNLFKQIDKMIIFYQSKLNKLQALKKAFLQKIFI